ncbi:hypothetical protein BH11MYX1_BH11MYX1_56390 [soil metagenome]
MKSQRDLELMEHADGEVELDVGAEGQQKVAALHELGELVRGRLELAADDVPEAKFASMWREIDKQLELAKPAGAPKPEPRLATEAGLLTRFGRVLERYRSQILTGAVSAGAVAALALILRGGGGDPGTQRESHDPIKVQTVAHRPAEIEALETPNGTSSVFNVDDEDGSTTVIWVTPEDTVEGI